MWAWQKQFAETADQRIRVVTALAVDPAGAKLACYGSDNTGEYGYLFVLDTSNGAIVSGLMELQHRDN